MALLQKEVYYIENNHEYNKIKNLLYLLDLNNSTIKNLSKNLIGNCIEELSTKHTNYDDNNYSRESIIALKNICFRMREKFIKYYLNSENTIPDNIQIHDDTWWENEINKFNIKVIPYNNQEYLDFDGYSLNSLVNKLLERLDEYTNSMHMVKNKFTLNNLNNLSWWERWTMYFNHGWYSVYNLEDYYNRFINQNLTLLRNQLSTINSSLETLHKNEYLEIENINETNLDLLGKFDDLVYMYSKEYDKYTNENTNVQIREDYIELFRARTVRLITSIKIVLGLINNDEQDNGEQNN